MDKNRDSLEGLDLKRVYKVFTWPIYGAKSIKKSTHLMIRYQIHFRSKVMDAGVEAHRWHAYYCCTRCEHKYEQINRKKTKEAECTSCCTSNRSEKSVSQSEILRILNTVSIICIHFLPFRCTFWKEKKCQRNQTMHQSNNVFHWLNRDYSMDTFWRNNQYDLRVTFNLIIFKTMTIK